MRYYCLCFDREKFYLTPFEAKDEEDAWKNIEENEGSNILQDWLLTEEQLNALKEVLK